MPDTSATITGLQPQGEARRSHNRFTALFAALALLFGVLAMAPSAKAELFSMPMHGNWCGPGTPANPVEASFPPIDPLDAACYRHDMCYAVQGNGDCGCDIALMTELKRLPHPTPALRDKARAMYDAIGLMPCTNPIGTAYKQRCVWGDLAFDAVTGRAAPWEMPLRFGRLGLDTMENKLYRNNWWGGW